MNQLIPVNLLCPYIGVGAVQAPDGPSDSSASHTAFDQR